MASVPTIRIGYVPGMSLTELSDRTFCDLHLYAACDMFFYEVKKLTRNFNTISEHYLTPLHLAVRSSAVSSLPYKIALSPFPSGTGHMITSLRGNEIDIAIGLTEGWVAGLTGKTQPQNPAEGGYKVIGHWVDNPLRWAIVTGRNRDNINGVSDLKDQRVGVSRLGRYVPLHSLACGRPSNRVVRLLADYTAYLAAPISCPSFSPSNRAGSQTLCLLFRWVLLAPYETASLDKTKRTPARKLTQQLSSLCGSTSRLSPSSTRRPRSPTRLSRTLARSSLPGHRG